MWDTDNLSSHLISYFFVHFFLLRAHFLNVLLLSTHLLEEFTLKTVENVAFLL